MPLKTHNDLRIQRLWIFEKISKTVECFFFRVNKNEDKFNLVEQLQIFRFINEGKRSMIQSFIRSEKHSFDTFASICLLNAYQFVFETVESGLENSPKINKIDTMMNVISVLHFVWIALNGECLHSVFAAVQYELLTLSLENSNDNTHGQRWMEWENRVREFWITAIEHDGVSNRQGLNQVTR